MRAKLNAKNKIKGINTWAIPILNLLICSYTVDYNRYTNTWKTDKKNIHKQQSIASEFGHPKIIYIYLEIKKDNIEAKHKINKHAYRCNRQTRKYWSKNSHVHIRV